VAWFIGQSTIVIVLAFGLGLVVGWLLWARRMRLLTVEVVAARIRAAEHATGRSPYGRRITWTSSGRIAVDAHTPIGDRIASGRSPVDRDADGAESLMAASGDRHGDADTVNAVNVGNSGQPRATDAARHGPHIPGPHIPAPHIPAPHIPAPRIEPADVADRDECGFDGFDEDYDDDDDFDAFDHAVGDLRTPFDSPFDPRFDDLANPSDLRGLDRFRDLFTSSNGHVPRTPEPRRREPELAPSRGPDPDTDRDRDPNLDQRTTRNDADDTTLAAAGLTGDVRHNAAVVDPDPATAEVAESDVTPPADSRSEPTDSAPSESGKVAPSESGSFAPSESGKVAPSESGRFAPSESGKVHASSDAAPGDDGPRDAALSDPIAAADDLTRIDGIGPKAAAALVAAGVRTFDDLAAADGDKVATALRASGVRLTSGVHAWPLAAHRLAVRRIVDRAGDSAPGAGGPRDASPDPRRGGLLPKRRSPGTPARRSIPPDALDPDDFARIEGIGPTLAAALVASGIRTFAQLASVDEPALRRAIGNPRSDVTPSLPTWPTQASLLATGDEDGFAELTARLIAGRSVDDELERIDGIGPQTSAALRAAGIRTFRALAATDANRLRAAIERAGLRPTSRLATWPVQARALADGDEEGVADLARRVVSGHDDGPV
jgi:predicted flap endonuclease-1-like 5' DNA nuclease